MRIALGLVLLALLAGCRGPERPARPSRLERELPLQAGTGTEVELAGGETHAWRLVPKAGHLLGLVVDQRGIDVVARLRTADGRLLTEVDSPNGDRGPEPVPWIAETAAPLWLEVHAPDPRARGRYAVQVEELRPATPWDRRRVEAERTFAAAEVLRRRQDAASLRAAAARDRQALAAFRSLGLRRRQADVLDRLGGIHLRLGETEPSRAAYREAADLFRTEGLLRETGNALNGLGRASAAAGEPQEALRRYREALAVLRGHGHRASEASLLNNIGRLHAALGQSQAALEAYEQALAAWQETRSGSEEGKTIANRGRLYAELGEPRRALDDFHRALPLLERAGSRREAAGVRADLAVELGKTGRAREGLAQLRQALPVQRELGDRRGEAVTRNALGWLHETLGEKEPARRAYVRALAVFRSLGDHASEAAALTNLGRLYGERGDPAAAIEAFGRALPLFAAAGSRDGEAVAIYGLARTRLRQGDLAAALHDSEQALEKVEGLRREAESPGLRTAFFASRQDVYELQIDILMRLDRQDPRGGHAARAFETSERARARSLLDALAEAGAAPRGGASPELLAREAALGRQVNAAERRRQLLAGIDAPPATRAAAEEELRDLLSRSERLRAEVRRAMLGGKAGAEARPATLREIQAGLLDRDTVLLEYALGRERSFLWAVTPQSLDAWELPPRAEVEDAARRVHALLSDLAGKTLARGQTGKALADLGDLLLAPVAGRLAGRRLLIAGDGALHYVPFAALPQLAGTEFVGLPSASSLLALRRMAAERGVGTPGSIAVVADPVFDPADPRLGGRPVPVASGNRVPLPRLRFSRQEAAAILRRVPAAERFAALDLAASRETVTGGALGRFRILHFATHGVLDAENPELSGIALSMVDRAGRPRDGFLRSHEIYRLSLPADLVVLSGCQTALGREIRGEGLVGLTQSFFHAGARAVLVSLWPVEDRATAELMGRFYGEMLDHGRSPAASLRAAQAALRRERRWEAPYFWAGFVLQGDGH